MTKLDLILNQVKKGMREVTFDTEGYTNAQIKQIKAAAKSRGLNVAGTNRWLLVRDLSK